MLEQLMKSRVRARVLGWLLSHPDKRYFVRQLEAVLGEDSTNLSRELARLEGLGILSSEMEGRQKHYRANRDCPLYPELRGLALKTVGLADVLREALTSFADDIDLAFVYGSSATGELTAESDVDLLVVGNVDEIGLHSALASAEPKLGRPVNCMLFTRSEFRRRQKAKTGFLARVLAGPRIAILGDANGC